MIRLHFPGGRNPAFRTLVETVPVLPTPLDPREEPFRAYRKTALTYAAKVYVPFEVETLEGMMQAKAGDYLAVGAEGEMYPIDAEVFERTYVPEEG